MCKHTEICIDIDKVCNGRWDCYDGSDEDMRGICAGNFSCSNKEFRCDSMMCIPEHLVCDGRPDCEDRSDEKWTVCKDRVQNCVKGTFACAPTKQCLPDSWKCDGRVDCPDRSDERNCEPRDCDADHFQCLTGQCIPLQWACDGRANCRDGSDELHCYEVGGTDEFLVHFLVLNIASGSTRYCRKLNEYLCRREQRCIRRSAVCDGIEDCVDGQDERKCHGKKCALGLFSCRNGQQCIAGHLECDGVADCDDASDEHEHCSFNAKVVEARCQAPDITCRTFTGIVCLPAAKICDGNPDCYDAKDEEFCGLMNNKGIVILVLNY
ncbi:Low-density lipoprotein receptor domain class A [Cooperia oncophora]